jgi:hypothetical protein
MAFPGRPGDNSPQDEVKEPTSAHGDRSTAEASNPPEKAAMNEMIVGVSAEEMNTYAPPQESVELVRKVRAALMAYEREDFVDEIRAQIKAGDYGHPEKEIAAKIIEHRLQERQQNGG